MVAAWLRSGVIDQGRLAPTERGSPQGGVISPVLMNVALHGMEEAAGVRYTPPGSNAGTARPGSPVLIRYADDALALCHSRAQAEQVKARLAAWLAPRGLVFNEDKTRIVHLDEGLDFLGFSVRRYRGKLLIKPSKAAVKRIKARLTAEMKALRGHNAQMVLIRLNPVIPGLVGLLPALRVLGVRRAGRPHVEADLQVGEMEPPSQRETLDRPQVLRQVRPPRRDRWVSGDRDSGAYLLKFAWTKITRHTLIKGWASPDDPALTSYWAARRRRGTPPLDPPRLRLLQRQRGRCPLCGQLLLHADQEPQHPDEWEQWIKAVRKATRHQAIALGTRPGTQADPRVPPHPHPLPTPPPRRHRWWTSTSALTFTPSGLARAGCPESGHGRFRGRRRGNAPPLPDERWFGMLTDKLIRRGVHTSVSALENDIRDWIATWNDNPRPFTWTKTADEILNSLGDYLAKLGAGNS